MPTTRPHRTPQDQFLKSWALVPKTTCHCAGFECNRAISILGSSKIELTRLMARKNWVKVNARWHCPACLARRVKEAQKASARLILKNPRKLVHHP